MRFKEFCNNKIVEAIQYNVDNGLPLSECVFRRESKLFYEYFNYLKENKDLQLDDFGLTLVETDLGQFGEYAGEQVPLDLPFVVKEKKDEDDPCWKNYKQIGMKKKNGKEVPNCVPIKEEKDDVELNKPKRGGAKKFYVYVKDGDRIKKVSFGDTTGLKAKISDPEARKAFAARHNCDQKKDRTKAGYWSCNLPRYAKALGLSGGGNFYW